MASKDVYNERLKLAASTSQNLAVALTIVTVGVTWNDGIGLAVVFWSFMTILLYAIAYAILGNLEDHEP